LGETSLFQITADSLRRARGAGFRSEQVVQFLSRQGEGLNGTDLAARLATVEAAAQGLDLGLAISIECNGEEQASAVLLLVESQSYAAIRIRTTVYVVIGVRRSALADRERIEAALDAAGLGPITNHIRW